MSQKKIFVPTENTESWKKLLADPELHWKDGYSAKSVAEYWEKAGDLPPKIRDVLLKNENFSDLELLFALPEYQVELKGKGKASQNDLFGIMRNGADKELVSFTVEAKAAEGFDKKLKQWLNKKSDNKAIRLDFLLREIGFPQVDPDKLDTKLRYQLFHRTASAVIMAKKFNAKYAVMIVQSFEGGPEKNHFGDFENFVNTDIIFPKITDLIFRF